MRYLFFFCTFLRIWTSFAQKNDNVWILGYDWSGTKIDFLHDSAHTIFKSIRIDMSCYNASICNDAGDFQCVSNGYIVAGPDCRVMANGTGLNPGPYTSQYGPTGMPIPQGGIILPLPEHPNLYYLIHETIDIITPQTAAKPLKLFYSIIDMQQNNGMGEVISKNNLLIQDTLVCGAMTAVKHANGRDWWILKPRMRSNAYYKLLLSPNGIEKIDTQFIGYNTKPIELSQAVFSLDGTKYVRFEGDSGYVYLFDFNRCNGNLNNPQKWRVNVDGGGGCALSPNGNVLYISVGLHVYQFDLTATDIAASKQVVAIYDGFQSPFGTTFNFAQLAADGRIYLNCTNGDNYMHVIDYPDSLGLSCGFRQHGLKLPSYNSFSIPNYPNFRLGAMQGSACDSLMTDIKASVETQPFLYCYPNPVKEKLNIGLTGVNTQNTAIEIYNYLGERIYYQSQLSFDTELEIDVIPFPQGVYKYRIFYSNQSLQKSMSGSFIKN